MLATAALLTLACVHAFRQTKTKRQAGSPGKVDALFTLGAPGPFAKTPGNLSIDCFPGVRLINTYDRKEIFAPSTVDMVPSATARLGLRHFRMDIGRVDHRYKKYSLVPCSDKTRDAGKDLGGIGRVPLHMPAKYEEAKPFLPPRLSTMTTFARMAYNADKLTGNRNLAPYGYRVVGTATSETDWKQVSHLTQNRKTLGCTLTFHGTEGTADWIANFQIRFVNFCSLDTKVHNGFSKQLLRMVNNPEFQANIKPKLPYCKTLTVVGHSMGGAVGELLAACLANAPGPSDPDYAAMSFTKETPKLINED